MNDHPAPATQGVADKPRKARWTLADLLDYELLLQQRAEAAEDEVAEENDATAPDMPALLRDEVLGRANAAGMSTRRADIHVNRRWWLLEYTRAWQRYLRTREDGTEHSPGKLAEAALRMLYLGLITFAGLFALGMTGTLLAQPGRLPDGSPMPVNVFWFLGVFLLPQVVLLLFSITGTLARAAGWTVRLGGISRLIAAMLQPLVRKVLRAATDGCGADFQASVKSTAGLLLGRGKLHRASLAWVPIQLLQGAGLIFSLVLFVGVQLLPQFRQVTFGWQTTNAALTPERVHEAVQFIALPWLVLGEGTVLELLAETVPSLEEIRGSLIDINQGAAALDPAALGAWWPFLCVCLFIYGVIPRTILCQATQILAHRARARERFEDSRSELLLGEIARWGELSAPPTTSSGANLPARPDGSAIAEPESGAFPCLVVLAPELDTEETRGRLAAFLADRLGWRVLEYRAVYTVPEQEALLKHLAALDWSGNAPRILFVQRWNAAIVQDTRALVRQILERIGGRGHIIFGLGGKVRLLDEPITRDHTKYWREYANELMAQHPNVEVLPLAQTASV